MIVRHKVPTIFNIYMLDVICCALGCVILLWQVNAQEAEQQTAAARAARDEAERNSAAADAARRSFEDASQRVRSVSAEVAHLTDALAESRKKYQSLAAALSLTQAERDAAQTLAARRQKDHDKTLASLTLSEEMLKKFRTELASLKDEHGKTLDELTAKEKRAVELLAMLTTKEKQNADLQKNLTAREKLSADLLARIAEAEKKIKGLEVDVTDKRSASEITAKKLEEQLALLRAAEAKNKKLELSLSTSQGEGRDLTTKLTTADLRAKVLEQDLERQKKELADNSQRYKDLLQAHEQLNKQLLASTRELTAAQTAAASLEKEKARLQSQAIRIRQEAEQRFAGITLTGRNVIFLVDMSGSMQMIDTNTEDPDKWPKVAETIAQLMRSLPDLERFQVVLFSDRVRYLFGHEGQWLKFDGEKTVQLTVDALKAVKPQADTNVYAGFAETFKFKPLGLDTVYFLSDGLPSAGEGLPTNAANIPESQKTELLSKYLRQKLKTEWNRKTGSRPPVRINTIGFFFESPDVGAFLWALAREHDGSFVGMSKP